MKYLRTCFIFWLFICLTVAAYAATKQEETCIIINLAAKQRMLSQKMSKEILLIAQKIDVDTNRINLEKTAKLFDKTLIGLLIGDEELGLVKTENADIVRQLNNVGIAWKVFSKNVKAVLGGNTSRTVLQNVAFQNLSLLINLDEAVQMYEKLKNGSAQIANTINKASKQRMLTQKMTKELLLVAADIESVTNKNDLAATVSKFDQTLNELIAGTKIPAIITQLDVVKNKWEEYKPILDKVDVSKNALTKAAALNMLLLGEMNKVVQMYVNFAVVLKQ
jgi:hypothetical protein